MLKKMITFLFSYLLIINVIYSKSDTLKIYYKINESELTISQLSEIDNLLEKIKEYQIEEINIYGYTDFLASTNYNSILSIKRAFKIKNYLNQKGYSNYIKDCEGKGELLPDLENQPLGIPENRKSEIIVLYREKKIEKKEATVNQNKEIVNAKVGENFVLKNFNFLPGRHYLTEKSYPELEKLLYTLLKNPNLKIEIQGHICCENSGDDGLDSDTYTKNLSVNRAKYIYEFLIKNQISADRLSYKGFGSRKPLIVPEITEEDQNQNRRVEIKIIEK